MASRPKGYGMTAELERKKAAKHDPELERQARQWIEAVTGERIGPDFQEGLKSGEILCKLINNIKPGAVKKVNNSKMAFKMMENIGNFLDACHSIGMNKGDLFQTVDLYEAQNMPQVVNGIHALGRKAQNIGYRGPRLGVKESQGEKRQFTDQQMRAGEGVIGLQAGYTGGATQSGQSFGLGRQVHHEPKY